MNVKIYNQYYAVYDEDKTLIHPSSGYTVTDSENLTDKQAKDRVIEIYNELKTSGLTIEDKIITPDKGYVEFTVTFEDGRILNKVIYIK